MSCAHSRFGCSVLVERGRRREAGEFPYFLAQVRIECSDCGTPFTFLGLPAGVNLDGACTDHSGECAILGVAPRDEVISDMLPAGRVIRWRPA